MRELRFTHSPRRIRIILIILLSMLAGSAVASQIRPLNLDQMSRRADRIFAARCLDVRLAEDPELEQPVTFVTLAVTRRAKGDVHGQVTIKLLGRQDARDPDTGEVDGLPRFAPGEEVVLFLYGDSTRGLTSPVGFGQGKFAILADKKGRRVAINAFGNRFLLDGLDPDAVRRLGASHARWRGRADIPADDLLDMVQTLLGKARP